MKITLLFAGIILAALLFAGCQEESALQSPATNDPNVAALGMIDAEVFANNNDTIFTKNRNFIGILAGRNEVPPTDSKGRGVAKFKLSKDGSTISYKLIVANISNVTAAHIHRGGVGENGPAVFELFSDTAAHGRTCGPIAEGTFTPADLAGPYAGATDFSMFLADLHADSLYVNVHTSDGVDSTSDTPGDYNNGEIRGQLRSHPWKWHGWDGWNDKDGGNHGKGHDMMRGRGHDKDGDGKDDHRNGGGDDHDGDGG